MILCFLALVAAEASASQFGTALKSASESLDNWQINAASILADQALSAAANPAEQGYAYFLKSQIEFHRGDYRSAAEFAQKARPSATDDEDYLAYVDFILNVSRSAEKFKGVKSGRFLVRYIHPKDKILVAAAADTLHRAYAQIGEDLGVYPEGEVAVEIYPDKESFTAASTLSDRDIRTTGVVGICKFNRIMILSPRLLPAGYRWQDTLAHEYVHYAVFHKAGNSVPVWLHEGLAKYYEKRWRRSEGSVINPFYETLLARAIEARALVPIEKMHPSLGKLDSTEQAQLAFAQVGGMIEFLVNRWGSAATPALLEALKTQGDYKAAFKKVAGVDFQRFYALWTADLKSRNLKERIPNLRVSELEIEEGKNTPKKSDGESLAPLGDSRARDHARLGDLLRARGRLKAAAYEYEKASRLDPLSPVIVNRLASAESGVGEFDAALKRLARLTEFYPEYVETYKNLGEIYIRQKLLGRARAAFEEAEAINPFDPEIRLALASIYGQLGLAQAEEEQRAALGVLLMN
ncbi:MAG: peptidase MA family metallohydrolase [Deltaproteobacteria bacterium]